VKILIADDDDATRFKLQAWLTKRGYEVVVARNGAEAWEQLQRDDAPTLAILDWIMPQLDGVEVCRRVRQSGKVRYIYIVMLTIKGEKKEIVAGMEAGADDYLSKPFDYDELRVRLRAGERILTLQEELRAKATYDDLTGVFNRGTILEILQRDLAHAERTHEPVAVILVDLDDFKRVNDTHGHAIGDAVLREAAKRLSAPMRPYDTIGRYGGEEFLIILPGCAVAAALQVAERVRLAVSGSGVNTTASDVAITVSLGVAAAEGGQREDVDALIQAADEALFRAKRAGRNRAEGPQSK
jgi:two-component system cell cycle response regulator